MLSNALAYWHPARTYICRHCGREFQGDEDGDPELCMRCGPICGNCFEEDKYPCEYEKYYVFVRSEDGSLQVRYETISFQAARKLSGQLDNFAFISTDQEGRHVVFGK